MCKFSFKVEETVVSATLTKSSAISAYTEIINAGIPAYVTDGDMLIAMWGGKRYIKPISVAFKHEDTVNIQVSGKKISIPVAGSGDRFQLSKACLKAGLPVYVQNKAGKIIFKGNFDKVIATKGEPVHIVPESVAEEPAVAANLWIDGSCSGNPGPGGWGVYGTIGNKQLEIYGGEANTTNNRMELTAAVRALSAARKANASPIYITSDSNLVVKGCNEWLTKWVNAGWVKANKNPVENADLWKELHSMLNEDVCFIKTKGHSEDKNNNRADELAKRGTAEAKAQ